MVAASSRFQSVCEDDFGQLLVETIPDKTKMATKYGIKIFHGKKRSRKKNEMILFVSYTFKCRQLYKRLRFTGTFFLLASKAKGHFYVSIPLIVILQKKLGSSFQFRTSEGFIIKF